MKKFPHPDDKHLEAAEGWLELGNWQEANEELENIRPELRAHPKVLLLRLDIYWAAKKWEACVEFAGAIVKLCPDIPEGWIGRSFALHELKRTQEAHDLLLPIRDKFPKDWSVPYNLACYCAQLNRLDEAEKWFKQAMAIDEQTIKYEAIDDPDLIPLWDSMSGMLWKRE